MGFDEWREGEAVKAQVASPVEPKIDVLGRSEFHGNFVVFPCKKRPNRRGTRGFLAKAGRFGGPRSGLGLLACPKSLQKRLVNLVAAGAGFLLALLCVRARAELPGAASRPRIHLDVHAF